MMLDVTAARPKQKRIALTRYAPPPIFGDDALHRVAEAQKLFSHPRCQLLALHTWVRFLVLTRLHLK